MPEKYWLVTEMPMVRKTLFVIIKLLLAGMCLLPGLGYMGCGIKAPPVPPHQPPAPVVEDLSYQMNDHAVTLTWRLAGSLPHKQAKGSAFGIYRARISLAEPACEGCPIVFEKVASMPYVNADDNRFSTVAALDPGYRYLFKVRLETNGRAGADTNPVQIEVPPAGPSAPSEMP